MPTNANICWISSVQFSHSVMSKPLQLHEPQHTRPPCPSPTPRVHPNSYPTSPLMMPSNHVILCHPLLFLPSIFPSIRVFSNGENLGHCIAFSSIRIVVLCHLMASVSQIVVSYTLFIFVVVSGRKVNPYYSFLAINSSPL